MAFLCCVAPSWCDKCTLYKACVCAHTSPPVLVWYERPRAVWQGYTHPLQQWSRIQPIVPPAFTTAYTRYMCMYSMWTWLCVKWSVISYFIHNTCGWSHDKILGFYCKWWYIYCIHTFMPLLPEYSTLVVCVCVCVCVCPLVVLCCITTTQSVRTVSSPNVTGTHIWELWGEKVLLTVHFLQVVTPQRSSDLSKNVSSSWR